MMALALSLLSSDRGRIAESGLAPGHREIVRRAIRHGAVVLAVDDRRDGHLYFSDDTGLWRIPCERLDGAWGLWVDDVDGDLRADAIVALRKRARFDPAMENRLNVYSFEEGRCVPAWRGTRLAARFDDLAVDETDRGALLAWERSKGGYRVTRYRWRGFGYGLERVLWRGDGAPPTIWRARFDTLKGAR